MLDSAVATGQFEKEVCVRRGDTSHFRAALTIAPVVGGGRDMEFLVAIRNVTAGPRPIDHIREAVETSQAILSGQRLDEVLRLIVRRARALLRAEAVWVALTLHEEEIDLSRGNGELTATAPGSVTWAVDMDIAEDRPPILVIDAAETAWAEDPVLRAAKLGQVVGVTLAAEGKALGTLYVANRRGGRPFQSPDLEPLQLFADQASLAIKLVEMRAEGERVAAMERERLARDLHDGTIQALYAVTLGLQGASSRTLDWDLKDQLASLAGAVQIAIEDLRNYIFALGPSLLAGRPLHEAVLQLVSDFQFQTGLVTVADVDPAAGHRLAEHASEVIQIVREALSNVGRHAHAQTCRLSLRLQDGGAELRMEDDGVGFDPAEQLVGRNGLRNLRDRVALLGGRLEIESAPNAGSALTIDIPLLRAKSGA
jgi:signal transduction histidine kinase